MKQFLHSLGLSFMATSVFISIYLVFDAMTRAIGFMPSMFVLILVVASVVYYLLYESKR